MRMACHQGEGQSLATAILDQNLICPSHQSTGSIWNAPLMTKSGVGSMRSSSPPVSIAMGLNGSVTCANVTEKGVLSSRDSSGDSAMWRTATGAPSEDYTRDASVMAGGAFLHAHDQGPIANGQRAECLAPGPGEFELVDVIVEDASNFNTRSEPQ